MTCEEVLRLLKTLAWTLFYRRKAFSHYNKKQRTIQKGLSQQQDVPVLTRILRQAAQFTAARRDSNVHVLSSPAPIGSPVLLAPR